jgi:hypothetical protein
MSFDFALRSGRANAPLTRKSSDLQTLSVGSKSQMIGAKEQRPKRACSCALAYMMLVSQGPSPVAGCNTTVVLQ